MKRFSFALSVALGAMLLGFAMKPAQAAFIIHSVPGVCEVEVTKSQNCGTIYITANSETYFQQYILYDVISTGNVGRFQFWEHASGCGKLRGKSLKPGQNCALAYYAYYADAPGPDVGVIEVRASNAPYLRIEVHANGVVTPGSFEWRTGEWGACTGGSATWLTSDWTPGSGCGLVTQIRSVTCSVNADSGTRSRTISCVRTADNMVIDTHLWEAYCGAENRPVEVESCTPEPSVCGASPETSRTVELRDACAKGCTPDPTNGKYCLMLPL